MNTWHADMFINQITINFLPMKKHLFYFVLPLVVACSPKSPKEAVVAGKISNYSGTVAYLTSRSITDTIALTDGAFVIKKAIDKPQLFELRMARHRVSLYLVPGDSTYVEYNFSDPTPVFAGDNVNIQNGMVMFNNEIRNQLNNWRELYAIDNAMFNAKMDSIQQVLNVKFDSLKNEPKELVALELARVGYGMLSLRLRYPEMNAYLTQKDLNPDEADFSMLSSFNPNIAEHLMFPDYCEIVKQYVDINMNKMEAYKKVVDLDADVKLPVQFKLIDSLVITNATVRDFVKMNILNDELTYGKFYTLGNLVEAFVASCTTPQYATLVLNKYNSMMVLAPGKPAPAIVAKNIKGEEVSLEQFRGNLVYVDFWATWCGPCRGELPYLEKLQDEYKGKKMVFISLSLDDNIEAWEKMVNENKMKGVQLHATGAWSSEAAVSYKIMGIPTFYLIGADGNIVAPGAPRPSSEEIRPLLNSELEKL